MVPAIELATEQTRHNKRRVRNIGYKKFIIRGLDKYLDHVIVGVVRRAPREPALSEVEGSSGDPEFPISSYCGFADAEASP